MYYIYILYIKFIIINVETYIIKYNIKMIPLYTYIYIVYFYKAVNVTYHWESLPSCHQAEVTFLI